MKLPTFFGLPKKPKLLVRRVSGSSMLPAYPPGHIVVARSFYRQLAAGDVVILRHNGLEKMKRIAVIENDRLFITGDNSAHSTDSRTFGWVSTSVVIGQVIWPRR